MNADAWRANALAPSNPIARLTGALFGLIPAWLPLLLLRLTLARPFFASGLTRWDGWFTLSFGTKILFEQDYKLHVFGSEIPFPMPRSVICSPTHIMNAVPVVSVSIVIRRKPHPAWVTTSPT